MLNQAYDPATAATVKGGATLAGVGGLRGELTLENGGTMTPGSSSDATGFASVGSVTFEPGSRLGIDLGGPSRGATYDGFTVYGHAALDGELLVQLVDGFVPDLGDYFLLTSFGSSSGAFASIVMPELPVGLGWDVSSDAQGSVEGYVVSTVDVAMAPPAVTVLGAPVANPFTAAPRRWREAAPRSRPRSSWEGRSRWPRARAGAPGW
jgi:hypothetical protein